MVKSKRDDLTQLIAKAKTKLASLQYKSAVYSKLNSVLDRLKSLPDDADDSAYEDLQKQLSKLIPEAQEEPDMDENPLITEPQQKSSKIKQETKRKGHGMS
jgi:hypothetical protein